MKTIVEEADERYVDRPSGYVRCEFERIGFIKGGRWQRSIDKELIDMLIDELQTSRAYLLGITGLDSDAEIARKEQEGNTALIRGIDRTIKYVKEALEE